MLDIQYPGKPKPELEVQTVAATTLRVTRIDVPDFVLKVALETGLASAPVFSVALMGKAYAEARGCVDATVVVAVRYVRSRLVGLERLPVVADFDDWFGAKRQRRACWGRHAAKTVAE